MDEPGRRQSGPETVLAQVTSSDSLGFELWFWIFVSSLETPDLWCSFSKIKSSRCLCKNCLEALILNHLSLIFIWINNETILFEHFQSQFESEFLYIHWRSIHSNNRHLNTIPVNIWPDTFSRSPNNETEIMNNETMNNETYAIFCLYNPSSKSSKSISYKIVNFDIF